MSSSNQQEQLYRWVKASERLPEQYKSVPIRPNGLDQYFATAFYDGKVIWVKDRPNRLAEISEIEWLEPYTPPVEEMKAEFNLNDYILVQITNYGWEELEKTKDQGFIEHCIKAKKEVINGVDYYKLQAHFVIETFGEMLWASFPSPLQPKILVPYKSQPSTPVQDGSKKHEL